MDNFGSSGVTCHLTIENKLLMSCMSGVHLIREVNYQTNVLENITSL